MIGSPSNRCATDWLNVNLLVLVNNMASKRPIPTPAVEDNTITLKSQLNTIYLISYHLFYLVVCV
uniref:Uncharacterized protein n=1 Tax=Anguilla anguilla TaxID=7936 RepID=A0A0E9X988_ANGAN